MRRRLFLGLTLGALATTVRGQLNPRWLERKRMKMTILGNSITIIENPDNIIWWGTWGMAATTANNDYAHLLTAALGNTTTTSYYCASWEQNHNDPGFSYSGFFGPKLTGNPNVILIRLGENVNNLTNYQADFETLINYCKATVPSAAIYVTGLFWTIAEQDAMQQAAANACGVTWISLAGIDDGFPPNRSQIGTVVQGNDGLPHVIESAGVAIHPSDAGMALIAQRITAGIGVASRAVGTVF